jgi:hypothetical protein
MIRICDRAERALAARHAGSGRQVWIERGATSFAYVYDFGDNREHTIRVEAALEGDPAVEYPRFVAGERRGLPEDVGGTDGYFEFVKAATRPQHREHRQVTEWYGGPYDPDNTDEPRIVVELERMARKRTLGMRASEEPGASALTFA